MASTDEFAAACKAAAKGFREVDKDLRRELSTEMKNKVAAPLASKIGSAARGPWARILQAGTKARAGADPTIVVGGARPRLTGGGGPRSVVFGVEFKNGAGPNRVKAIPRTPKRAGHRRRTTQQFRGKHAPFVYPTIADNLPWVLDEFADVTLAALEQGVNGNG